MSVWVPPSHSANANMAPMIVEAQRDAVHRVERQRVTDYLTGHYDGGLIMAFAIAATGADAPTTIEGASAVAVSYPDFFETLERLTRGDGR